MSKPHRHLPTSPPICSRLGTQQVMTPAAGPHLDPAPPLQMWGTGQWLSASLREKAHLPEQQVRKAASHTIMLLRVCATLQPTVELWTPVGMQQTPCMRFNDPSASASLRDFRVV